MTAKSFPNTSRQTLLLALIGTLVGCGNPDLSPVRGKVQIEGVPAVAGRVVFRPKKGGETGIGHIQSDGRFELQVKQKQNGARIGDNHVLIIDAHTGDAAQSASYRAPEAGGVDVKAKTDNEFVINVALDDGWSLIDD